MATLEQIIREQERKYKVISELSGIDTKLEQMTDLLGRLIALSAQQIETQNNVIALLTELAEKELPKPEKIKFPAFPDLSIPIASLEASLTKKFEDHFLVLVGITKLLSEMNKSETPKTEAERPENTTIKMAGGLTSRLFARRQLGKLFRKETPIGAINGTNREFRLTHSPFAGFLILELNGMSQIKDEHFTLAKGVITYTTAPPDGSKHEAIYF